jgi:hypothetical protein
MGDCNIRGRISEPNREVIERIVSTGLGWSWSWSGREYRCSYRYCVVAIFILSGMVYLRL